MGALYSFRKPFTGRELQEAIQEGRRVAHAEGFGSEVPAEMVNAAGQVVPLRVAAPARRLRTKGPPDVLPAPPPSASAGRHPRGGGGAGGQGAWGRRCPA